MIKLASRYLKNYLFYIIGALIMIAIQTYVQMVLLMGEMKKILDQGVAKQDMDFVYSSGLTMIIYTIIIGALTVGISYLTSKVSGIFMCRMRKDCYSKVLSMTPEMFDHFGESTLITRTIEDPKAIVNLVQFLISRVVMIPMVVICILALIYIRSKNIFLILLVAFVIALTTLIVLEIYAKRYYKVFQSKIDRLNQLVREKITGVRSIRAFGNEELEEKKGLNHNSEILNAAVKANQPLKFMNPVTMIIFNWVMVLIYYVGTNEIKSGLSSISSLILVFQYLSYFTMALSLIPTLINMLPKAQVSVERVLELLDYGENASSDIKKADSLSGQSIECKGVTFGYDKNRPVLKDISFKVNPGETLGVIGATGSGKSTLLQVLMGFYEIDSGELLVSGKPIETIDKKTLLNQFAYAPQKAYVFQDSIRNNINSYNEEVSDEEVLKACEISRFDEVLDGLESGLDTKMAQGGMNLSGGQRKRLSLARAVAKNSPIYLLDDPYAALDAITESVVSENIKKNLNDRILIIVSSKISSIKDADNILVLEEGKVAGLGTHEELLMNCKEYKDIYDTQCYLDREE